MIDTGADISLLSSSFVKELSRTHSVEFCALEEKIKVLGGTTIDVNSKCFVDLVIGEILTKQEFWVAPMAVNCLLGGDFLKNHQCIVNYKERKLTVSNCDIRLEISDPEQNNRVLRVVLESNVKIKPYTEVVVQARVLDGKSQSGLRFVGPTNEFTQSESGGVVVGKTLVNLRDGHVPVRIVNLSPGKKKLRRMTEVALCEPCDEVGILSSEKDCNVAIDEMELPEYLQVVYGKNCDKLDENQKKSFKFFLLQERDVFSSGLEDIGRTGIVQHKIDTGDQRPIKQAPRRLPLSKKVEAESCVKEMSDKGIIEPSSSPWCSPIVLVKKKDGSTRFCVDYRRLNGVTKKDAYPLPRLDVTLDSICGSKWFSTLDLKSGYWQVELDEKSKEKTAFSTGQGLWQFRVMPFGLCNAPATFQRLMEAVLSELPIQTALVYIDDILVHAKDFNQELQNLREVFQKLRKANLKLNPKKCVLFANEVAYLGHIVSCHGVSADPSKVKAIQTWPVPETVREVRCFLGICSYYRKFILDFAKIAKPLHKLTEKGVDFLWSDECSKAFEDLKAALQREPVLAYPDFRKPYVLDTDASKDGLGAVLSQVKEDGREHVIAYYSRTLSKQETNYCVTRRELLAIVSAIEHFSAYLYGSKFVLRTDHSALQWLLTFKNPKDQLARWLAKLQQYDFTVIHRAGNRHCNADALSRRPCSDTMCRYCERREREECIKYMDNPVDPPMPKVATAQKDDDGIGSKQSSKGKCWSTDELRDAQLSDPSLRPLILWLEGTKRPEWGEVSPYSPTVKAYWAQWDSLVLKNGVLYRKFHIVNQQEPQLQLVVPVSIQDDVLRESHDEPTSGHFGVAKTMERLKERFYWVNCRRDVGRWCQKCEPCGKRKGPKTKTRSPIKQHISGAPMERLAVDIMGPLPTSEAGNKYLMVVGDYFTKWTEAIPLPNQEAKTVADALVTQVITRFGVPDSLHSDQGRNFESKLFTEVCRILGINKTRTTPYRPQSDGMVERFNRTLEDQLAKYVDEHQKDWDRHVPFLMMAYRTAVHQSTGFTASKLMLGREIRLPMDLMFGRPHDSRPQEPSDVYVENLENNLEDVHQFARVNLRIASDDMKRRYDERATHDSYFVGQAVRYCLPKRRKGLSPKFQSNWDGPYLVKRKISDLIYEIQRTPRAKPRIVHKDRLCKFHGDPPDWFKDMAEPHLNPVHEATPSKNKRKSSAKGSFAEARDDFWSDRAKAILKGTDRGPGKRVVKPPSHLSDYYMF